MTKTQKNDNIEDDKDIDQVDDQNDDTDTDVDQDEGDTGDNDNQDDDGADDADIDEEKLRKLGWVPKGEWKGDPDNWMDPETFRKKRGDELSQLRNQNREMRQTIEDFKEFNKTRDERAYKRAMKELEKRKMAAVEEGDKDAYKQIQSEEQELREDFKEAAPKKPEKQAVPDVPPEVEDWIASNPWFDEDAELRAAATAYHGALRVSSPKMSLEDNLRKTTEHIKKIFPEKFSLGSSRRSSAVEGSRFNSVRTNGGGSKKKSAADLPPEAKDAGNRFVRQGLYKDLNEYAKDYFTEE